MYIGGGVYRLFFIHYEGVRFYVSQESPGKECIKHRGFYRPQNASNLAWGCLGNPRAFPGNHPGITCWNTLPAAYILILRGRCFSGDPGESIEKDPPRCIHFPWWHVRFPRSVFLTSPGDRTDLCRQKLGNNLPASYILEFSHFFNIFRSF